MGSLRSGSEAPHDHDAQMNNTIAQLLRLSHCSHAPRHTQTADCRGVVTITANEVCLACPLCGNERIPHDIKLGIRAPWQECIPPFDPVSRELKMAIIERIKKEL